MLFSFCLEVFSKTLYLLRGKGGIHKSGSFFHLVKLPLHPFEYKQKNIFDYYLKCCDSSACFAPWNRICFRQKKKKLLLCHKMAILAKNKGVLRRDCTQSNKKSSLKVGNANRKENLFFRSHFSIPIPKPVLLLHLTPGLQLPVSLGSSDILLSQQLSFNLAVPFNQ